MGQELVVIQVGGIRRTEGRRASGHPYAGFRHSRTRHRILHRQHPKSQHPQSLCARRRRLCRLVRGHGLARAPRRAAGPRRDLYRGAGATMAAPSVKLRSSPRSACSSTGSSSARSVPMNPASAVRGPKHVVKKARRRCSRQKRPANSSITSTPHITLLASRSGPHRPPRLYLRPRRRGCEDARR